MIDWKIKVFGVESDIMLLYKGGSGESSFRACRKLIVDAVTQDESEEQLVIVELRGNGQRVDVEAIVHRSTGGKVYCTVRNFGIVDIWFHLENLQELWGLLKFDFAEDDE